MIFAANRNYSPDLGTRFDAYFAALGMGFGPRHITGRRLAQAVTLDRLPDAGDLEAELEPLLADAADYEDVLTILRRWTNDKPFQAGVHLLLAGPARHAIGECPSSDDLEHAGRMTSGGSGSLLLKSMTLSDDAASGAF